MMSLRATRMSSTPNTTSNLERRLEMAREHAKARESDNRSHLVTRLNRGMKGEIVHAGPLGSPGTGLGPDYL